MTEVPTKTLPSGDELPGIGLGTWDIGGETVQESVRAALDAGYTHIDTAEGYKNEGEIGEVLAEYGVTDAGGGDAGSGDDGESSGDGGSGDGGSGDGGSGDVSEGGGAGGSLDREDLFITSKVLGKNLHYESVIQSCRDSLDRLGTEYLDLYLIHWPNPAISLRETLDAMATLHEDGLVRNVGVSNFSAYQLSCAHHVSDVPIAVNQIEFHPLLQRPDLVEYCRETETIIEAAAPLARTNVFDEPVVRDVAEAYDRSPAQVALRWAIDRDVVPLPKSSSPDHVRSNFELFDWDLAEEDLRALDDLDRDEPVYDHPSRSWTDDVYGISP